MTPLNKIKLLTALMGIVLAIASCKKFVAVGAPKGSVDASAVYSTDAAATAAVLSLYSSVDMQQNLIGLTQTAGLAADELNYLQNSADNVDFQRNSISTTNNFIAKQLWQNAYGEIVNANADINGLESSTTLTPAVKNQLLGEAKFWRALTFFDLVNCFGDVPLTLDPIAINNALLPRSQVSKVYGQIISDLKDAEQLAAVAYPSAERVRVNKYAVSAMLARVYLYRKDWANAEAEASAVIGSNVYSMSAPDVTFSKTSNETILQVYNINGFTTWGGFFVPTSPTTAIYSLDPTLVDAFEVGDKRRDNWISALGTTGSFAPYKYKLRTATAGNEYYIVLRLAELYLIRAEARTQQGNLTGINGAEADLNMVRSRAELVDKKNLDKPAMLLALERERRVELFAEYGHRWFDLKRTPSLTDPAKTRADDILAPLKGTNWQSTDVLFPISSAEIGKNPALIQTPGY